VGVCASKRANRPLTMGCGETGSISSTADHSWISCIAGSRSNWPRLRQSPNSGLGKAISYLLNHWQPLTLFLREKGAPLDNNICERAWKKAIQNLSRKNAMFYKTPNGAMVGDQFMSLIHTCELNGVNSFRYLIELQRHAAAVKPAPADWMPWNYGETVVRLATPTAAYYMMDLTWSKRIVFGHLRALDLSDQKGNYSPARCRVCIL
jgi:hypothetical protein